MWGIRLDREGGEPLKRQIYRSLRDRMVDGRMGGGEKLPSTRMLASELRVSRNTVCEAYEMLLAEGFTVSRPGAPTRVAEGLALEPREPGAVSSAPKPEKPPILADFTTGKPDLRRFPRSRWERAMARAVADLPLSDWGYTGPGGLPRLREEIAAWLFRRKGLRVDPADIFVTAGATQALHLVAGILGRWDRGFYVEDPCHVGMLRVLQAGGYPIYPVPVDGQGMCVETLPETSACAVYVTPSHQFPLGGILPAVRRAALIRLARERDLYLIEDDYDSEFRYCGDPIAPLYAMDPLRVIYIGTFSKVLFPALRIGYTVLPRPLQRDWRYTRAHTDVHNPPFEQAALALWLSERGPDTHVERMGRLYGRRRAALIESLHEAFGDGCICWGDAAGLHVALEFPGRIFDMDFASQARQAGIRVMPVEYHTIVKGCHTDKLLLGYGHLSSDEIAGGVLRLRDFIGG